jgi:hypothetical protein
MKLAGDAFRFPNHQHQLQYNFGLLVGKAIVQVDTYISDEGCNLLDVRAMIMVLEMAFRDPKHMVRAE